MSDASEHVLPTVEETIDGNKITFGKLSVTDRARILRNVKAAAIAQHIEDTSVLPPEQQYSPSPNKGAIRNQIKASNWHGTCLSIVSGRVPRPKFRRRK